MSAISKRGIKSNPVSGRPFSLFELLGNKQTPEAIRDRYSKALELAKSETIGVFTNKNGFSISRLDKWTEAQKRKLRRYYNMIAGLQQFGVRVKTPGPRDKKARVKAQRTARHPGLLGKLKHVYVPGHPDYKPRIVVDRRGVSFIRDKYLDAISVLFRPGLLAMAGDDEDIVHDECVRVWTTMLSLAGKKRRLSFVTLITGEYESIASGQQVHGARDLFEIVMWFLAEYEDTRSWLKGITGYFKIPGAKLSQGSGSRDAIHADDLAEKRAVVRKMRRSSSETRVMMRRRVQKDTETSGLLDAAYKEMDLFEQSYAGRRERGEYVHEATYGFLKKEHMVKIKKLTDKALARSRFNKRSKK